MANEVLVVLGTRWLERVVSLRHEAAAHASAGRGELLDRDAVTLEYAAGQLFTAIGRPIPVMVPGPCPDCNEDLFDLETLIASTSVPTVKISAVESVTIYVDGLPPAKNEALSMLSEGHGHRPRVVALLSAIRDAVEARPEPFTPWSSDVALDLVVFAGNDRDPWDATNYLGGVADVLEDKSHRSVAIEHLGDLGGLCLYRNDRQIKRIAYSQEASDTGSYRLTVRALPQTASP